MTKPIQISTIYLLVSIVGGVATVRCFDRLNWAQENAFAEAVARGIRISRKIQVYDPSGELLDFYGRPTGISVKGQWIERRSDQPTAEPAGPERS